MKRYLTVLVLLVLLATMVVFALPALAEEVDYKAMSTDELIAMRGKINDELRARLASDASATSDIYSGSYKVGVDINPGIYLFTCLSVSEGAKNAMINKDYMGGVYLNVGDSTIINLSVDDGCLNIFDGSGTIQPTVKPDWAP